jgi:hypothetical protein
MCLEGEDRARGRRGIPPIGQEPGNDRLADLDINIGDAVFNKKVPALVRRDNTISARKRCGKDTNPEGGWRSGKVFDILEADNIKAGPLNLHRVQKAFDLGSQVIFPNLLDRMVTGRAPSIGSTPLGQWAPSKGHLYEQLVEV